MSRLSLAFAALGLIALCGLASATRADDAPKAEKQQKKGFGDFLGALKKSPGCLGVETARTASGKQVVFAWFKDKRATLKWYYSDVHRGLMHDGFPDFEPGKALQYVPEDAGPIMAVASITLTAKPHFKESTLPISQIAIELYQPLPGGLFFGGRFAPADVPVPHLRDATPKKQ